METTVDPPAPTPRFLTLPQVLEITEELNISQSQAYALVRGGDLIGIQIGGRAQWRVERNRLEQFITDAHRKTADTHEQLPPTRLLERLALLIDPHWFAVCLRTTFSYPGSQDQIRISRHCITQMTSRSWCGRIRSSDSDIRSIRVFHAVTAANV